MAVKFKNNQNTNKYFHTKERSPRKKQKQKNNKNSVMFIF